MLCVCLAVLALGEPAGEASAAAHTPVQADAGPDVETVTVTAERPPVVHLIDREIYSVKDNPQAQAGSAVDALKSVPSVSVSAQGRVTLLGSPGVTVLIDGKRPQNQDVVLRALPGADIDRIEVMTNPSAQFRPDGGGGIINIVTRSRRPSGGSGAVLVSADSQGGRQLTLSPNLTRGRWTFGATLGDGHNERSSAGGRDLTTFDSGGGTVMQTSERRDESQRSDDRSASVKVGFKPADDRTLTLTASGNDSQSVNRQDISRVVLVGPSGSAAETADTRSLVRMGSLGLDYQWSKPDESSSLTVSALASTMDWDLDRRFRAEGGADYRTDSRWRVDEVLVKLDYRRPAGAAVLSLGGELNREDTRIAEALEAGTGGAPLPDYAWSLDGRRDIAAGYGTLQFDRAGWTVLPGLRVEGEAREVRSAGASADRTFVSLYPSLHLSRALTERTKLRLSYSRRVDRPDITELNPAVRLFDSNTAFVGNPDLRSASRDAFEVRLQHATDELDWTVTLYDRESHDVWDSYTELTPENVKLSMPINAGDASSRGAEVSLRKNFNERWRVNLTANLAWRGIQVLEAGRFRSAADTTYSLNGQLERRGPARADGADGDQLQLQVRYFGPQQSLQRETSGFVYADLTWRRSITKKAALTLTASDLLDGTDFRSKVAGEGFSEVETSRGAGRQVKASLSYRWGG
ncbi:outer membrane beta-barrel family protein [Caulobacter sp. 17J80-11]|uniref:TonB-dependent receptor n=1 Tax=Caulobacter sp. 17J80-11 TaxID=2763502 RepID=UPI00165397D7